jgi:hypothetical protein
MFQAAACCRSTQGKAAVRALIEFHGNLKKLHESRASLFLRRGHINRGVAKCGVG